MKTKEPSVTPLTEKSNMKLRLFQSAMELFRAQGYGSVSILEICKHAGVTRNAFYYYYNSKEDLLSSYFEDAIHLQTELFADLIALPNDWEKLWFLFETHLKLLTAEGIELTREILKINIDHKGGAFDKYFLTDTWCIPLIRNCQQMGLIQNQLDPKYLNYLATRLSMGIIMTWCNCDGDFELIPNVKQALETLFQPTAD